MYGPSFVTGSLIARFGAKQIVALGLALAAVMLVAFGIAVIEFEAPKHHDAGGQPIEPLRRIHPERDVDRRDQRGVAGRADGVEPPRTVLLPRALMTGVIPSCS